MENSLKRKAEDASQPTPKKQKSLPKHGRRLFIEAKMAWSDQYGRKKNTKGIFMVDSGCTGPMLNQDFVGGNHIPWVRRDDPITIHTADGEPMNNAGEKYVEDIIMRIQDHQEELSWEIS